MNMILQGLRPAHPGEILREDILPALNMPKTAIAGALGVSRETLYKILTEKRPVTPIMALKLGKALGNSPQFWLNLQTKFDLAVEAEAEADSIAEVKELVAA